MHYLGFKNPTLENFRGKIELLITYNLPYQKRGAVCRVIAISC